MKQNTYDDAKIKLVRWMNPALEILSTDDLLVKFFDLRLDVRQTEANMKKNPWKSIASNPDYCFFFINDADDECYEICSSKYTDFNVNTITAVNESKDAPFFFS